MDSYFLYALKMEYGFIFHLHVQNVIWIHTSFICSKWNMDSYFVYMLKMEYDSYFIYVLKMEYGFMIVLLA